MAKNKKKKFTENPNRIFIWIGIFLIIVLIIIYLITLGKLNFLEKDGKSKRLKWIEDRLASLEIESKNKIEIKRQLDERVKKWFLYARCILGGVYLILNVVGFYFIPKVDFNDKISVLLNYNQFLFFIMLMALFIRYETPSDFKDFFRLIHLQIKKLVYKNHKELVNEIELIVIEINKLSDEKKTIQEQIENKKAKVAHKKIDLYDELKNK